MKKRDERADRGIGASGYCMQMLITFMRDVERV